MLKQGLSYDKYYFLINLKNFLLYHRIKKLSLKAHPKCNKKFLKILNKIVNLRQKKITENKKRDKKTQNLKLRYLCNHWELRAHISPSL